MKLTQRIVAGTALFLLAYEGWTLVNREPDDTISETIWGWFKTTPFLGFLAGLLCGHFFWQSPNVRIHQVDTVEVHNDSVHIGQND